MLKTPDIAVTQVSSKADKKAFLDFPYELYRGDRNWIAPLRMERAESFDPAKNPYFEHADVAFFLARRNDKVVGRISAQVCQLVQKHHGQGLGQFGCIEMEDDPAIAAALIGAAEDWLRQQGMTRMQGPFELSINEVPGLLIDGFDTPSAMLLPHHKPYYQTHLETAGFDKVMDAYALRLRIKEGVPPSIERIVASTRENERVRFRPINMGDWDNEVRLILDIFNDAWSDNWGYVPFTEREIVHLAKSLKILIGPKFSYIAEVDGQAAAFMVNLPDVNRLARDLHGRLLPFGWAKLLYRLKMAPITHFRVPMMGVRKKYQKSPLGAGLALGLIEGLREYAVAMGGEQGDLSWILETNTGMVNILKKIGSSIYKTYRFYEKPL